MTVFYDCIVGNDHRQDAMSINEASIALTRVVNIMSFIYLHLSSFRARSRQSEDDSSEYYVIYIFTLVFIQGQVTTVGRR